MWRPFSPTGVYSSSDPLQNERAPGPGPLAPETSKLEALTSRLLQSAYNPSTILYYNKCYDRFQTFLRDHSLPQNPPFYTAHIALFVSFLFSQKLSLSTIRTHLGAIAFHLKLNSFGDNTKDFLITRILKGINSSQLKRPKLFPINKELLHKLCDNVIFLTNSCFTRALFRAILLFAYYGCFRIGEIVKSRNPSHTLLIENVSIQTKRSRQSLIVTLLSFKHSKDQTSFILDPLSEKLYCPVVAFLQYLTLRPKISGPVFIAENLKVVTRDFVATNLKRCLKLAGSDPKVFNTHSLRVGRATDLAMAGTPDQVIKQTGRWRSDAYLNYIRFDLFSLP